MGSFGLALVCFHFKFRFLKLHCFTSFWIYCIIDFVRVSLQSVRGWTDFIKSQGNSAARGSFKFKVNVWMQRVVGLVPFYWLITTVHCKGRSLLSSNNLIEHVINFDMLLVVTISSLFKIKAPVQSCWHVTLFFLRNEGIQLSILVVHWVIISMRK